MIRIYLSNQFRRCRKLQGKFWNFPAGEFGFRLTDEDLEYASRFTGDLIEIEWNYENDAELVQIAMIKEALVKLFMFRNVKYKLNMPYIPYARQDRRCNEGEAASLTVIAGLINGLGFDFVEAIDPHSIVAPAVINNLACVEQLYYFLQHITEFYAEAEYVRRPIVLIAPDQGASKKTMALFKELSTHYGKLHNYYIVTADKERDLTNGEIVRTVVDIPSHIPDSAIYLVVDDICDGGRTFVELAKAIPEEKRSHLHLLVTHGIFSQGLDVLRQYYSEISCINLMNKSIGQLGAPLNSTIKL